MCFERKARFTSRIDTHLHQRVYPTQKPVRFRKLASTSKQSVNCALRALRLTFHYVRCKQTRLANRNL